MSTHHYYCVTSYDGQWVVKAPSPRSAKSLCRQFSGQRLRAKRTTAAEFKKFNDFIAKEYRP